MKKPNKKSIILILVVIEICTLFLVSKSLSNKSYALDNINILNQRFKDGNMFAAYLRYGEGEYYELSGINFPVGDNIFLNMIMSGCIDSNGDITDTDIIYENGNITLKTNQKLFCYLYFDYKDNLLYDEFTKDSSLIKLYDKDGYYKSEIDKDTQNPYFSTPIYYWNNSYASEINDKDNVFFSGYCWIMIRTTNNNGVKLLYNGEPIITYDEKTGETLYDCTRTTRYTPYLYQTESVSFSGSIYYGTGYTFDNVEKKFTLTGVDSTPTNLSSSTIDDLIGKYTCKLSTPDGTCSRIYYIDSYDNNTYAYAIPIGSSSYNTIGKTDFSNPGIFGGLGYMYGGGVTNNTVKLLGSSPSLYSNDTFDVRYSKRGASYSTVYSDSYTFYEGVPGYTQWHYGLNGYKTPSEIKAECEHDDNTCFIGKITPFKTLSSSNKYYDMYRIVGAGGIYLYDVDATNGDDIDPNDAYTITGTNQIVVQSKAFAGVNVPVESDISGYVVSSFRVNGTLINGDSFVMPAANASITDVKFVPAVIVDMASHNPYPSTTGTITYYENTFTGATSIKVLLSYNLMSAQAYIKIYQTNSSTEFGTYSGWDHPFTVSLTIPGDYIKIDWYNGNTNYLDYYGFKARVVPIYEQNNEVTLQGSGDGSGSLFQRYVFLSGFKRYISNSVTYNNGTYTLNNPILFDLTNWNDSYNEYYTCSDKSSTQCSLSNLRLITSIDQEHGRGLTPYIHSLFLATSYTYNNGVFTLSNPIELKTIAPSSEASWNRDYANYGDYHYYVCEDPTSTTCSNLKLIRSTSRTGYDIVPLYSFSNSYTYDNGVYRLNLNDNSAILPGSYRYQSTNLGLSRYTCLNYSGECTTLKYIISINNYNYTYLNLTNGQYVSVNKNNKTEYENDKNVIYLLLHGNNNDQIVKKMIDNWYKLNLYNSDYEFLIDRKENFCFNMTASNYNYLNPTYSDLSSSSNIEFFYRESRWSLLNCPIKNDSFSAEESEIGNGDLTYPIGLLSVGEAFLNEDVIENTTYANSSYFWLGGYITSGQAMEFSRVGVGWNQGTSSVFGNDGMVRPAIALVPDATYVKGTGARTNPYLVGAGNYIIITDSDFVTPERKAISGKTVKIYLKNKNNDMYEVSSFKLNGTTINGNTFTMPNTEARITDIQYTKVTYDITNTDSDVDVLEYAKPGINVTLKSDNYIINSFDLNGNTITGDTFTMPSENVIITNIDKTAYIISETTHYPVTISTKGNITYYENTFQDATSLTVKITCDWSSDSNRSIRLYKINNSYVSYSCSDILKTDILEIPGNYLKIVGYWNYDNLTPNMYGFKARILPNYE